MSPKDESSLLGYINKNPPNSDDDWLKKITEAAIKAGAQPLTENPKDLVDDRNGTSIKYSMNRTITPVPEVIKTPKATPTVDPEAPLRWGLLGKDDSLLTPDDKEDSAKDH